MKKSLILIIFIILTGLCITIFNSNIFDVDACLDGGICKKGLTIKLENGKQITVNSQTCTKNNGKWDNKRQCYHF